MESSLAVLIPLAATVGFIHTLSGPDHYIPFIVMARARNWSWFKTGWITALCGLGHVGSSILLGIFGIFLGLGVSQLEGIESVRGDWAAWAFLIFGIIYLGYGIWRGMKNRPHKHFHSHGHGHVHVHPHDHAENHLITKSAPQGKIVAEKLHFENMHNHEHKGKDTVNVTPWVLFVIFVLGPCEPLIPIFIYPAAEHNFAGVIWVSLVFSLVTIVTMLTLVFIGLFGLKQVSFAPLERWMHAIAGAVIALSGVGILFLGL